MNAVDLGKVFDRFALLALRAGQRNGSDWKSGAMAEAHTRT